MISREKRRRKKIKLQARIRASNALRRDPKKIMPEEERIENSVEPKQRPASGRVFTGNDCEYIRLTSLSANDGCTDGE